MTGAAAWITFAACCVLSLPSCQTRHDYTGQIRGLDSLRQVIMAEREDLDHYPLLINDSILADVQFLQDNFRGEMKPSMAKTLAAYSLLRNDNDQLRAVRDTLLKQGGIMTNRCSKLLQAIAEQATHDADKNELTPAYVGTAFANEKQLAADWTTKTKNWKTSVNELKQQHDVQMPVIRHWVDSIQQKIK